MSTFKLEPTKTAEWQALVAEALFESHYNLDESLEFYLVITLDSFTTDKDLINSVVAIDYLEAIDLSRKLAGDKLRSVGDHCLVLSGLFPERILRKNVSLNYFINIGKQAYKIVATHNLLLAYDADLFHKLSDNFVGLMDVLHTMRQMSFRIIH